MTPLEFRAILTASMAEANKPVLARLDEIDARVCKLEGDVSSSDLSAQAKEASMIVAMTELKRSLDATEHKASIADHRAKLAHKRASLRVALSTIAKTCISAIATAIGAYLAVKGIHL
jgi:ABC-type protease/lipase transport system fused ATPase/permease subunit